MKPVGAFLWACAVALLLRSTAVSSLAARGLVIDVLALATVLWSLRQGDAWGASFGFLLGIVADLDAAHWLGRHALLLTLLGYAVGRLSGTLVRDSARTQFALIAVGTLVHQLWASAFELGGSLDALPYVAGRSLLATAVTAGAGTLILIFARRLTGRPLFGHASRTASSD